jgi:saccharopine dehydrogenase-like NADP-dependent oxidoreductase
MTRRVLLIGATGVFGMRLAAMLARMPALELVLAARGIAALERLRDTLSTQTSETRISTLVFDRRHPESLAVAQPWLVIDAAGPFQDSGYDLAITAVRAGAHYIDLADGRAFVAGFPAAVEPHAVAVGVLAVTGASSTPALSHAALARLTDGWRQRDTILVAISPGARAPRGLSVIEAILSYVGQPIRAFLGGAWRDVDGWSHLRRLAMRGLGRRWLSICDTPDLDLLPQRFPAQQEALFMAGLELAPMHLGLTALGWLVRLRLVSSLRPLAATLRFAASLLAPFGSDRGGMIVDARGRDADDRPIHARWSLWAAANAGPHTPAAPAAALTRALLDGAAFPAGARTAAGLLSLDAILHELANLPVSTSIDESHVAETALFRRLLGRRFADLPPCVRVVHDGQARKIFAGKALARVGRNPVARIARRLLNLPSPGRSDVQVTIAPDSRGETWTRQFGASQFASYLTDTKQLGEFEEHFGWLRFVFRLECSPRGVRWTLMRWNLGGLPLPRSFAPLIHARAEAAEGRYRFSVVVSHRFIGLLFAYRGSLE